jgi:hypothetical protein
LKKLPINIWSSGGSSRRTRLIFRNSRISGKRYWTLLTNVRISTTCSWASIKIIWNARNCMASSYYKLSMTKKKAEESWRSAGSSQKITG